MSWSTAPQSTGQSDWRKSPRQTCATILRPISSARSFAQQAGLAMVPQPEGGCIVNFGDWASARPYLNYAPYLVSKGAIPALTRCLAVELGTRNPRLRVNCVLPGPVLFPPDMPEAEREEAIRSTLVRREGQPANVAAAVLFLVENDFVTGVCLPVDGGRTIYAAGS